MTSFFYKIYVLFLGISLFFLTVLFRLLRSKEEVSLLTMKENLSIITLIFYLSFFFFQLLTIIILVNYFYKNYYQITKKSQIITYLEEKINKLYREPLETIYNKSSNFIPGIVFVKLLNLLIRIVVKEK